jgi:hypothetical protein
MKKNFFILALITSFFLSLSVSHAFYTRGPVTDEIDYDNLKIYPPKTECDEPVVKGDSDDNACLAKVSARLTYAFTEDQDLRATLLFYNIFNEIMGAAEIEETLRWEEGFVDFIDYIYIYPEFDFDDIRTTHHTEWEIHKKNKDESMEKK